MARQSLWKQRRPAKGGAAVGIVAVLVVAALLATWFVQHKSVFAPKADVRLRISEVMAANASTVLDASGATPDWIEIENISDAAVALEGWSIVEQNRPNDTFVFTGGSLGPGERLVVCAGDGAEAMADQSLVATFAIPASGTALALLDEKGNTADAVEVEALSKDQVWCRDASGEWGLSDFPTPGAQNHAGRSDGSQAPEIVVHPGALVISEAMSDNATYFPDENGEYCDYVEVRNTSSEPVSLEGWGLSDSREKLGRWKFPAVTLPAGGAIAVHLSGADRRSDASHLHATFRLANEGDEIFLTDTAGQVADHVTLPALDHDQAWSLIETGWTKLYPPTPGYANDAFGADACAQQIMAANSRGVVISEVLASSSKSGDWIELCNTSAQAVDLSGMGLSDNSGRPRKWQFPQGTVIQPGEYLGVIADGQDGVISGMAHANFRLNTDGGYCVTLSEADGTIFDRVFVPAQYRDMSFGRPDGQQVLRYFTSPTPLAANTGEACLGRAPQPVYSVKGGLYQTGDVLTVSMSVPSDCRVYYTLDNTDPDQTSAVYTDPITITGTTVLRTRVYGAGYIESIMDAQSYLFDAKNGDGSVYVVSLVSDPYNLTDYNHGIMVKGPNAFENYPYGTMGNGANFWMDWEREAHVEIYGPDGNDVLSQECGIKLHGQYSRAGDQKAFKVIARAEYGDNRFHMSLFSKRPYTEYQSFLLRATGQDDNKARMRDSTLTALAEGTSVMYQETELCVLYLNGEYWGHYNLRERINTASICQFEGWEGDEDDIDLVKANTGTMQGSNETFAALEEWVKSHDTNTDEALEYIGSQIDIQNYIEYMAIEMYTGNTDTLNVKRYRNPKADGKWRWVLFDLDWAFNTDTNSVTRWLTPGGMGNGNRTRNTLFIACMKNDTFRDMFLTHLGQQMAGRFSAKSMYERFEERFEALKPIMPDHLERWGRTQDSYLSAVKNLASYAKTRPYRMLQFLKYCKYLNLTQTQMEHYFGDCMAQEGVTYDDIKQP